jgi:hypothetical protein
MQNAGLGLHGCAAPEEKIRAGHLATEHATDAEEGTSESVLIRLHPWLVRVLLH